MPIIKSSMKDLRRTARRTQVNRVAKGKLRSNLKGLRTALAGTQLEAAKQALAQAVPVIDRAVTKDILSKNAAARHKSRLMRRLNRLVPPATA